MSLTKSVQKMVKKYLKTKKLLKFKNCIKICRKNSAKFQFSISRKLPVGFLLKTAILLKIN